ncbi:MAG: peptidoglycan-binding domain-containing protein [Candidatus Zixiibacteriota bacterium]
MTRSAGTLAPSLATGTLTIFSRWAVGPGQPNRREDVIKVETILGNTGDHDLMKTQGPVGFWGEPQEKSVRAFQQKNGLKVDGLLNPGGPTISSLRNQTGGLLGGLKPPTPDEVDEHHQRLGRGEPGLLNTRPARLSIKVPDQVSELDEQTLAFNTDSARALTRTSVNGDVPKIYADYLKQAGSGGLTTVLDLVEQVHGSEGRDRAEQVLHGILGQVPAQTAQTILGGSMPAPRPIGVRTADLADDERMPLFLAADAEVGQRSGKTEPQKSEPQKSEPQKPEPQKPGEKKDGKYPPPRDPDPCLGVSVDLEGAWRQRDGIFTTLRDAQANLGAVERRIAALEAGEVDPEGAPPDVSTAPRPPESKPGDKPEDDGCLGCHKPPRGGKKGGKGGGGAADETISETLPEIGKEQGKQTARRMEAQKLRQEAQVMKANVARLEEQLRQADANVSHRQKALDACRAKQGPSQG